MAEYDVAIIGGGLNGVSVARDAAGRGLRVLLLEQADLGAAASSAASQLIQGDLALLERGAWGRVRAALAEREIWLRTAPHLVRPLRFIIPAHADHRAPWLLRAGLLAYDGLALRSSLPKSVPRDLTHDPAGAPLKRPFGTAFEFSDAAVDASRLTVLTALDAAERGADIRTGARCIRAERQRTWRLMVIDRGVCRSIEARSLVNATGAWTSSVAENVLRLPPLRLRLVKETRIVLRRLVDTDKAYVLQHPDGRLITVSPYQRDFTLIGCVGGDFKGDPAAVAASSAEIATLCNAVNRYLRAPIVPVDVVMAMSGANAMPEPSGHMAPDGVLHLDRSRNTAPLLTMCGGSPTTARRRAEAAVTKLTPFYPMAQRWTAASPLPGGDFASQGLDAQAEHVVARWPFLSDRHAQRLVTAYGTRVADLLGDASSRDDLGAAFGEDLTALEVRYLMVKEFARFADDVLWRRSKLGLTMPGADKRALAEFMAGQTF